MKRYRKRQTPQINAHKISTILFDWDGCLADTLEAWLVSYHSAIVPHLPWITREFILKNHLMADFSLIKQFKLQEETEIRILNSILEQVHTYGESVALASDILSTLEYLQDKGIQCAVVSSAPRSFIEPQIKRFKLAHYFPVLITGNDVTRLKPHPEPLLKALDLLKANPEQTIMIGDTRSDILAGKAAGTKTILYFPEKNESLYNKDDVLGLNADYYIRSFTDIHSILS